MKVAILCPDFPPDRTGLADHTAALAEHLAAHVEVTVITSQRSAPEETAGHVRVWRQVPQWGWQGGWIVSRWLRQLQPDWLLVQYVPHMYGRGGINLALPLLLWWWRWRGGAIWLLIHELYVPWSLAPKRLLAAMAQRLMLMMSILAARRIGVSTEVWLRKLERLFPFWRSRFHHLPTPSNIPVIPLSESEKTSVRKQLGVASDELVLGFFGTLHDSKLMEYVMESLHALEAEGQPVRLLCIGPTSQELAHSLNRAGHGWNDRIVCTGYVEAQRVSQCLSVIDIFLLPLIDGVSSRRSSLMAALSHGLPVVGTSGPATSALLQASGGLALSPADDKAAFLSHVRRLAQDASRRRELGQRGQQLYEHHFSWSVVVKKILACLTDEVSQRPATSDQRPATSDQRPTTSDQRPATILWIEPVGEKGGAEVYLLDLLRHLDRSRFRPVVCCMRPGPLVEDFQRIGVTVYTITPHRMRNLGAVARGIRQLKRIVEREQIDIIHSNGFRAHVYGGILAKLTNRPAAWLVHTAEESSPLTTMILKIPVQAVIANSKRTAEYFHGRGKPTVVAYPGIDPAKLERRMDESALRVKYQVADESPMVCMVGRFQVYKGQLDFLRAAVRVLGRFPAAVFFVVGEALFGMELDYAQSLRHEARLLGIESSVRFTGFIEDEELYGLMAASTMLVHPARSEDFGIVVAEAQALGKPVVAYRTSGPELILEDQKTGYLVTPGDIQELVARICELLAEPERARAMGRAGRQRVLERFSIQTTVNVFQNIYTTLADQKARRG